MVDTVPPVGSGAPEVTVVHADQIAVGGESDVALEPVGTRLEGGPR